MIGRIVGWLLLGSTLLWLWRYLSRSSLAVQSPAFSFQVGRATEAVPPGFVPPMGTTGGARAGDCAPRGCSCEG